MMDEIKEDLENRFNMSYSQIHDMKTNEKVRKLLNEMNMTVKEFTKRASMKDDYHLSRTHFYELINDPSKMQLKDVQRFATILYLTQFEASIIFMGDLLF